MSVKSYIQSYMRKVMYTECYIRTLYSLSMYIEY